MKQIGISLVSLWIVVATPALGASVSGDFGWDTQRERAERAVASLKRNSVARMAPRRSGHTVSLKYGEILFDGRQLTLSRSLADWKRILGGGSECGEDVNPPIVCKWENLGIEVGTAQTSTNAVKFVTIHLQSEAGEFLSDAARSGKSEKQLPSYIVKGQFSGNLELENYRIDQQTTFDEVQRSVSRTLNLRCDVRDCQFPHGSFNSVANIYVELNGGSVRSTINSISISAVE